MLEQTVAISGSSTRLLVRNYRYDDAGQLTDLHDNRRGDINYRYDPLGRLLGANSQHKEETFAFDPASNLLDPKAPRRPIHHPPPKLLDNLLRDYVGQHYTYDARGNLLERLDNGKKARFTWDLYDRLTRYEDDRLTADFAYDALGRRVAKYSKAHCPPSPGAGPAWIEQQQRTLNTQYDCGQNIYGWDGDTLAYETRYSDNPGERRLIHYFYEPDSFIPVAQTVENRSLSLVREPSHENGYHIDRDPLWQHQPVAKPFNAMAWYQCDHLGTPMELTDQRGEIAWSATYQAWGLAKEKRTDSAIRENIRNPLRFQGQYFDTETGLHYNRYRYYDPQVGRFISKDPIGFAGGLNVYAYAPNPVGWVDPFGLSVTLAERLANKAQNLPASKRPNTVAVITSTDGKITIGKNQGGVTNPEVQNTLDGLSPNEFSAQCAEVNAISRAKNKGIELKDSSISVANVRGKKSSSGIHGTSKPPCSVCNPLLNKFDMNLLERCHDNG